ncbi:MAG: hypothetical protein ABEI07_00485, partial [Candidatus Nanohaloarchaea archaeon]
RNVSESFNVTEDYTVTVNTAHDIYRKAEKVGFDVEVEDATGDPVEDYNLTLVLDKHGSNVTLVKDNRTDSGSYTLKKSDPPTASASASNLPFEYTVHANVSKNGNTGRDIRNFNVTRLVQRDLNTLFQNPQQGDTVAPGSQFNLTLDVNYPRGNPVTGAVVYARCNTCPSDFKFLEHQGNGIYSENFTAPTDSDSALIRAFVDDGSGNSESQADQAAPAISVDVTTATNDTTTGGGGGGGGGGGFGAMPPSLELTRVSPGLNLPPNTSRVNLSVRTDKPATCRYRRSGSEKSSVFPHTGGRIHFGIVDVNPGNSYSYRVRCLAQDNLSTETTVAFSVAQESIVSYVFGTPEDAVEAVLGGNATAQLRIYNNGTESLISRLSSRSDCCRTGFRTLQGERIEELTVPSEAGRVFNMWVSVPLNISTGKKTVLVRSTVQGISRERTVTLDVDRGSMVRRFENLLNRSIRLHERIVLYRQTGVDTSRLREKYTQLQKLLTYARKAKRQNNRSSFAKTLQKAESLADEIDRDLQILSLKQYILANWWRWALAGGGLYLLFFLVTMVALPYYRLRTELLNVEEDLDNAVEARKKAEKQYFRREIDRSTFMDIMTERQDEILELRGEKEDLEEELDTIIRRQLTVGNFVKAPLKAFREVRAWWRETVKRYGPGGREE